MNREIKLGIIALVPIIMWFISPPEGLSVDAWRLLGFYLAAILGLVLKPVPAGLALLIPIAASSIFLGNSKAVLVGYGSTTAWLVFSAFGLSIAFVKTGLGKRIAYILIEKMGNTTLRLGYVTAILDLIISPITPSNTARAGGIVYPIMLSISKALGSEPGETANKAGNYLTSNVYFVTKTTSFMFLTAMAPNVLAASYMKEIAGVDLDWGKWAIAMIVPGLITLAIIPLIGYIIAKPTEKNINNHEIAKEGLNELGPMKKSEKGLVFIFILALAGWAGPSILNIFGFQFKLSTAAVAIAALVLCFLLNVMKWNDMLENKGAWNTLLWFGGIIGMSKALSGEGFFKWLAIFMQNNINFGDNAFTALIIIGIISIAVRYLFASGSAYIVAMFPVFLTVGIVANIPPMELCLVLAATNSYGGSVTHYGGAAAPIIYGSGYNNIKSWWTTGAIDALVSFVITMAIGYVWWNVLGYI